MQKVEISVQEIVLLVLPSLGSSYSGPYVVQEKVNDRHYIVATPERKRQSRLCHINMLKPYLDRGSVPLSPVEEGKTVLSLSSAVPIDETQIAVVLSSADPTETKAISVLSDDVDVVEDVVGPSSAVVEGRLKILKCCLKLTSVFRI